MTFAQFNLPEVLVSSLTRLNFSQPTKIQEAAIPLALQGKVLIASAQTGSGKTAAFGIPLLTKLISDQSARALVLAPTRELAVQIARTIEDLAYKQINLRPAILIGGVSMHGQKKILQRNPRILVATPGRLVDLMRGNRRLLENVKVLVLDEADRMLDMGFAPLGEIKKALPEQRHTMLFSATYPTDIKELAQQWLTQPERIRIDSVGLPAEKIVQEVIELNEAEKKDAAMKEITLREGSILIFTRTKSRADRLTRALCDEGVEASQIHGGRTQAQRQRSLDGFRKGNFRVLVATDIAARGIDVPHIEHVINYDLPFVAEDYLHRIGRTGRAGRAGQALCFVASHERRLWRSIEKLMASKEGRSSKEQAEEASSLRKEFRGSDRQSGEYSGRSNRSRSFSRGGGSGRQDQRRDRRGGGGNFRGNRERAGFSNNSSQRSEFSGEKKQDSTNFSSSQEPRRESRSNRTNRNGAGFNRSRNGQRSNYRTRTF